MPRTAAPSRTRLGRRETRAWLLLLLLRGEAHGWDLRNGLLDLGLDVDGPTIYRTLRNLEADGHVRAGWEPPRSGPERRVYVITAEGRGELERRAEELARRRRALTRFLRLHRVLTGSAARD